MNDKSDPWQSLFKDVLAETDKEKLAKKVSDLEAVIFFRFQELEKRSDPDADEERVKLNDATHALFQIKVEKLGFPISDLRSFRGGQV